MPTLPVCVACTVVVGVGGEAVVVCGLCVGVVLGETDGVAVPAVGVYDGGT